MDRLDPRSPLVLDTRDLMRTPGSTQDVVRTIVTPDEFGTDVIAVPAASPLDIELRLESVSEGVLVTGRVRSEASGACVRCLEPVTLPVTATFQELFAYADRAAHHHEVDADADEADVYELVGDLIDLEPVLRDAVVTTLPFQPRCRADCPGLCAQCGQPLAEDPQHRHDSLDPRWAALAHLAAEAPAKGSSDSTTGTTPEHTTERRN